MVNCNFTFFTFNVCILFIVSIITVTVRCMFFLSYVVL